MKTVQPECPFFLQVYLDGLVFRSPPVQVRCLRAMLPHVRTPQVPHVHPRQDEAEGGEGEVGIGWCDLRQGENDPAFDLRFREVRQPPVGVLPSADRTSGVVVFHGESRSRSSWQ